MRDAIGSTFIFRLVIIFIVFYVCFACMVVNYAKVFRVKNRAIDVVEQYQSTGLSGVSDKVESDAYINSLGHTVDSDIFAKITAEYCKTNNTNTKFTSNGICVEEKTSIYNSNKHYYEVTSYIVIKFPVFTFVAVMPIKGYTNSY